mmetsp:Transcript_12899/g.26808  ORF Transcript_12899/g.26808 Transcript_12899/m.26808 type:complete len:207 (-) Transcript_12899:240-860(-)
MAPDHHYHDAVHRSAHLHHRTACCAAPSAPPCLSKPSHPTIDLENFASDKRSQRPCKEVDYSSHLINRTRPPNAVLLIRQILDKLAPCSRIPEPGILRSILDVGHETASFGEARSDTVDVDVVLHQLRRQHLRILGHGCLRHGIHCLVAIKVHCKSRNAAHGDDSTAPPGDHVTGHALANQNSRLQVVVHNGTRVVVFDEDSVVDL